MSLTFKNGWSSFRLFDELVSPGEPFFYPFSLTAVRAPRVDVSSDGENRCFTIQVELPGISENDIKVSFSEGEIEIRAERSSKQMDERGESTKHLVFYRCIAIPDGVNHEKIFAQLHLGVLKVTIPYPTEVESRKSVIDIPVAKL